VSTIYFHRGARTLLSHALPESVALALAKAAFDAQYIDDPVDRAARIDRTINQVREQYPEYFTKEQ